MVLRFGQYVRSSPPGIGYHLPYPFETVLTPRVTAVNRVEVGFRAGEKNATTALPEESLMLTGDENIVDIHFEVQWRIARAENYLFNVRNPDATVKAAAESAMREVIGATPIATATTSGKLQVEQDTQKLLQEILDSYNAGVEIVSVNLLKADPPAQVLDAQRDVQTALADAETARNQAEAYSNDFLPARAAKRRKSSSTPRATSSRPSPVRTARQTASMKSTWRTRNPRTSPAAASIWKQWRTSWRA